MIEMVGSTVEVAAERAIEQLQRALSVLREVDLDGLAAEQVRKCV